jgi:hypothetical protein
MYKVVIGNVVPTRGHAKSLYVYICVCVCIRTYIYEYICIYIYIESCVLSRIHSRMEVDAHPHVHTCMHIQNTCIHTYALFYTYMPKIKSRVWDQPCEYMYMRASPKYVCMYVCINVCMYERVQIVCKYVCDVCMYICTYVNCIYVRVYLRIHV